MLQVEKDFIGRYNIGGGTVVVDHKYMTVRIEETVDVNIVADVDSLYDILKMQIISGWQVDGNLLWRGSITTTMRDGWDLLNPDGLRHCYVRGDHLTIVILGQGHDERAIYMQNERIYPDEDGVVIVMPGTMPWLKIQDKEMITFLAVSERDILKFKTQKYDYNHYYIPINP